MVAEEADSNVNLFVALFGSKLYASFVERQLVNSGSVIVSCSWRDIDGTNLRKVVRFNFKRLQVKRNGF